MFVDITNKKIKIKSLFCIVLFSSPRSPGVIIGVTNPFFVKTLQHWPHVVRVGEMPDGERPSFFLIKTSARYACLIFSALFRGCWLIDIVSLSF